MPSIARSMPTKAVHWIIELVPVKASFVDGAFTIVGAGPGPNPGGGDTTVVVDVGEGLVIVGEVGAFELIVTTAGETATPIQMPTTDENAMV